MAPGTASLTRSPLRWLTRRPAETPLGLTWRSLRSPLPWRRAFGCPRTHSWDSSGSRPPAQGPGRWRRRTRIPQRAAPWTGRPVVPGAAMGGHRETTGDKGVAGQTSRGKLRRAGRGEGSRGRLTSGHRMGVAMAMGGDPGRPLWKGCCGSFGGFFTTHRSSCQITLA